MKITKEKIISLILSFFIDDRDVTPYELSQKTGADSKSLVSWKNQEHSSIQKKSYEKVVKGLKSDISLEFEDFSEFAMGKLEKEGISRVFLESVFNEKNEIVSIFSQLLLFNDSEYKPLQEKIGTASIIHVLKNLFSQYRDYFQINERIIRKKELGLIHCPLISGLEKSSDLDDSLSALNYIILKFPNTYHVGIFLSNYTIDFSNEEKFGYYSYMIEKIKSQYGLKMILIITDMSKETIPIAIQSALMEKHNLFFEFVKKKDLEEISIHGLVIGEENTYNLSKVIDKHRYAQLIFERFMSYLSVICNEIIFAPYLQKLHKELDVEEVEKTEEVLNKILVSYKKRTPENNFLDYAKETLLKKVCRYSYLCRHTIYYERALVAEEADAILDKQKRDKIPLVVEVCAPNSLTTCNIIDKCEKLLLFTASYNAYSLMKSLESKTEGRFFPTNVSLQLCHLNPEYMMHQYPNDLNGKVDFLIIGYGAGSQISNLTRFIRYAYNWLSEEGVLFISVYNQEAIVLNKQHMKDQRFESAPLYISDYWTYTTREQILLLKNLKVYSLENFQSTYFSLFDKNEMSISTYPYISALVNPGEFSREILDEIREADKLYASKGTHGQFINAIARKSAYSCPKEVHTNMIEYLEKNKIQYSCHYHTLAPDSKSLKRSLQAIENMTTNATLLKTIALQEKNPKEKNKSQWIYAILPYDKNVPFDTARYELVPETSVTQKYHQGTISPLAVIIQKLKEGECDEIIIVNNDSINTEYVIMSGGSNTESIQIRTKDFLKIATKCKVKKMKFIE